MTVNQKHLISIPSYRVGDDIEDEAIKPDDPLDRDSTGFCQNCGYSLSVSLLSETPHNGIHGRKVCRH